MRGRLTGMRGADCRGALWRLLRVEGGVTVSCAAPAGASEAFATVVARGGWPAAQVLRADSCGPDRVASRKRSGVSFAAGVNGVLGTNRLGLVDGLIDGLACESSSTRTCMDFRELLSAQLPPIRPDEPAHLRQDILDELSDHLICAYHREILRGVDRAVVQQRVLEHFGDPAALACRLWLDAMRGKITAQRVLIATCVLVTLACLASVGLLAASSPGPAARRRAGGPVQVRKTR